jgi:hypothetical protein
MTPAPLPEPSWRKPAGAFIILGLIAVWVLLVVQLSPWVERTPILVQTLFYLAAGIAWLWVLPLKRLLAWMETGRWRR